MPTTEQVTIKCGSSIDPVWTILRSNGFVGAVADEILQDAIVRRLNTERGAFWSDPDYGLMVSNYLLESVTTESLSRIALEVQQEVLKEERVQSVTVEPTISGSGPRVYVDLNIAITTAENTEMAFTLRVSEVNTTILTPGANV